MFLAVSAAKNCYCSSTMRALPKIQSVNPQSMYYIFGRLAGTCSNIFSSTNQRSLGVNIVNKFDLADVTNLRLFSTSVPVLCDSKSYVYKPKTEYKEIKPHRDENPSKVKKSLQNLFFKKLKYFTSRSLQKSTGYILYQQLVDNVNYQDFFNAFSMPDTFNSWFLIMELHVWLLSVRLMAEGADGKGVRNALVEAMWEDVKKRAQTVTSNSQLQDSLTTLSGQFNAAFIGYDEGLLTNDQVLASALWRRFFTKECDDPHLVESMVSFIRKQIHLLDNLTGEDILEKQKIILLRLSH